MMECWSKLSKREKNNILQWISIQHEAQLFGEKHNQQNNMRKVSPQMKECWSKVYQNQQSNVLQLKSNRHEAQLFGEKYNQQNNMLKVSSQMKELKQILTTKPSKTSFRDEYQTFRKDNRRNEKTNLETFWMDSESTIRNNNPFFKSIKDFKFPVFNFKIRR